jgi:hypothetical protein
MVGRIARKQNRPVERDFRPFPSRASRIIRSSLPIVLELELVLALVSILHHRQSGDDDEDEEDWNTTLTLFAWGDP